MKKLLIILSLLALSLCGCGKPVNIPEPQAAPTETASLEIVTSLLSDEEKTQRYVDALGVDLQDYLSARIFFDGRTYVFRGPGETFDFREMQDAGHLRYDAAFPAEALVTDCKGLDGFLVRKVSGGQMGDALNVEGDQYCSFLFLPEDAAFPAEEMYAENEDGTLTLIRYNGAEANYTVPQEMDGRAVTAIGENAFAFCPTLTSVTIPEGVTKIDHFAFSSCYRLETVRFPSTLAELGYGVFQHCPLIGEIFFAGPAVASDRAPRLFDGPVDGQELENIREWYPRGLDLKDITVYYPKYDLGWTSRDWAEFSKVPY